MKTLENMEAFKKGGQLTQNIEQVWVKGVKIGILGDGDGTEIYRFKRIHVLSKDCIQGGSVG